MTPALLLLLLPIALACQGLPPSMEPSPRHLPYQEQACTAVKGSCGLESECEDEVLHGYCPSQPAAVKCCRRAWQCSGKTETWKIRISSKVIYPVQVSLMLGVVPLVVTAWRPLSVLEA